MAGDLIGADPFRVAAVPEFTPGTISDLVTTEYVYAKYTALVDRGEIVLLASANEAAPLTLTNAAASFGSRIGVAAANALANEYGWVQVRGDVDFQADGSATANTQMYATATAGQIGITEEDGGALGQHRSDRGCGRPWLGLLPVGCSTPLPGPLRALAAAVAAGSLRRRLQRQARRPSSLPPWPISPASRGATTWNNVLSGLTTSSLLNVGGFTIETVLTRDAVIIPANGNYELSSTMTGLASSSTAGTARSTMITRFVRERAGVDAVLPPQGTPSYSRNQYGAYTELHGSHMSTVLAFETGDKIRVQALFRVQSSNPTLAIVGASSNLTIKGVDAPDIEVSVTGIFDRLAVAEFGDTHEFEDTDIGKLVNIHSDLHEIIPETDSPVGGSVTWGLLSASVAAFKGTVALWTDLGQLASPTNGDEYYVVQDAAFYRFLNSFWNVVPHPDRVYGAVQLPNATMRL